MKTAAQRTTTQAARIVPQKLDRIFFIAARSAMPDHGLSRSIKPPANV